MADSFNRHEHIADVEDMVRAAGQYVCASDDLRPRVLERARVQSSERRAQRLIRQSALFVLVIAVFTTIGAQRQRPADAEQRGSLLAPAAAGLIFPEDPASVRGDDVNWNIIDAFTEMRREQSELLRPGH